MKAFRRFAQTKDFWSRTSLVFSIGFLVLAVILLFLGNRLLEESTDRILENRLVIAELIANQLDRSFEVVIGEMERVFRLADFGQEDLGFLDQPRILEELESQAGLQILGFYFINPVGEVLDLRHPGDPLPAVDLGDPDAPLSENAIQISTPWHDAASGNLLTAIHMPVYSAGQFLGWFRCVVNLDEARIHSMLQDAVTLDNTAHGILFDGQGRSLVSTFDLPFLSDGEHHTFYRRAIAAGQPTVENVLFELDLPGEPVGHHHIMAVAPLHSVQWGIAVGGDVFAETFSAPYQLFILLTSFFILAVLGTWGATLFSTRRVLAPVRNVNLKFELIKQIGKVGEWDELVTLIARLPSFIVPLAGSRLFYIGPDSKVLEVSQWVPDPLSTGDPGLGQEPDICASCPILQKTPPGMLSECSASPLGELDLPLKGYCLPLVHNQKLVGALQFWISSQTALSETQVEVMTSISEEMAAALESHQLQRSYLKEVELTETEKRRIFRRLHDRLGQNISYLRLKLDQYSALGGESSLSDIQRDMERMRDIANEAYEQIRGALNDLHPETEKELAEALRLRAMAIEERSHVKIEITISGKPIPLQMYAKRHVLSICFEALNNVEHHAMAENAGIHIDWSEQILAITIRDDGVGFDYQDIPPQNHYGLEIIRERAELIGAQVSISPVLDRGTVLTLQVPLQNLPAFYLSEESLDAS